MSMNPEAKSSAQDRVRAASEGATAAIQARDRTIVGAREEGASLRDLARWTHLNHETVRTIIRRQQKESSEPTQKGGNFPPFSREDIPTAAPTTSRTLPAPSGRTYERAKKVVEAAESGDPEADATGKVTPSFNKLQKKRAPRRVNPTKLHEKLRPLDSYLKEWTPDRFYGMTPAEARRLLKTVQRNRRVLFEVGRALEARTVVTRALR